MIRALTALSAASLADNMVDVASAWHYALPGIVVCWLLQPWLQSRQLITLR